MSRAAGVLDEQVPAFELADAEQVLADAYGYAGTITALRSERDRNFMADRDGERVVLKVSGVSDTDGRSTWRAAPWPGWPATPAPSRFRRCCRPVRHVVRPCRRGATAAPTWRG